MTPPRKPNLVTSLLHTIRRLIWRCGTRALYLISCEWCLLGLGRNGGGVILFRSVIITALCYSAALLLHRTLTGQGGWTLNDEPTAWLGPIFAGVYFALYTRFASQWSYLAGLYNQIKQTETSIETPRPQQIERLNEWKAAFIEDCDELHLSGKALFASAIRDWGRQEGVSKVFASEMNLPKLEKILARAEHCSRW